MHDRIRLALSAAGIAAITLVASGHPLPFVQTGAPALPLAVAAPAVAPEEAHVAPVSAEVPAVAPKPEQPEFRVPRIRRTADADFTTA